MSTDVTTSSSSAEVERGQAPTDRGAVAMAIQISAAPASDSWGFVGVVLVRDTEAYRTLEAFPTPAEAATAAERLLADALGGLLAGQEWRSVRGEQGVMPTRQHFNLSALGHRRRSEPRPPDQDHPSL